MRRTSKDVSPLDETSRSAKSHAGSAKTAFLERMELWENQQDLWNMTERMRER